MQYNPTAKKPSFALPPGDYPAEVIKAEETTSKKGNPMLVVELRVHDPATGRSQKITDYIVIGGEYSGEWKIANLCASCGVSNDGNLQPGELNGLYTKVKLKIKPAKDGYEEGNSVADYLEHGGAVGPAAVPAPASSIPF